MRYRVSIECAEIYNIEPNFKKFYISRVVEADSYEEAIKQAVESA